MLSRNASSIGRDPDETEPFRIVAACDLGLSPSARAADRDRRDTTPDPGAWCPVSGRERRRERGRRALRRRERQELTWPKPPGFVVLAGAHRIHSPVWS